MTLEKATSRLVGGVRRAVRSTRLVTMAAVAVCVAVLAGFTTSSASAAQATDGSLAQGRDGDLVVSLDREAWADEITAELFGGDWVVSPGDSRTYEVYFRNDSDDQAVATAHLDLSATVEQYFTTQFQMMLFDNEGRAVHSGPVVTGTTSEATDVQPRQTGLVRVDLTMNRDTVDPASMDQPLDLDARLRLTGSPETTAPGGSGQPDPPTGGIGNGDGGTADLARTGAEGLLLAALAAVLLFASGLSARLIAAIARRRRREAGSPTAVTDRVSWPPTGWVR